jgi:hypothetical protein
MMASGLIIRKILRKFFENCSPWRTPAGRVDVTTAGVDLVVGAPQVPEVDLWHHVTVAGVP